MRRRAGIRRIAAFAWAVVWPLCLAPAAAGAQDGADRSYWTYDLSVASGQAPARALPEDCAPFFDDDPETAYRPPAPAPEPFDLAVLRACGPIRGRVTAAEFEGLVLDHMALIRPRLPADWQVLDDGAIHRRLAEIWLARRAFDHVFCGEWEKGRIGGLHFRGRYLQLQLEATACFRATDRLEFEPGLIYTIGVASADGAEFFPIKGYGLTQPALDLLVLGAAGFEACCTPGPEWRPYRNRFSRQVFAPSDEGGRTVMNRLICGADDPDGAVGAALVTLFPDATPTEGFPVCRF